jgi:hypothetical protein
MALSAMQKVGIALGFIPGVSTIVGAIKAFVYFRRASKHEKDRNQVHQELQSMTTNIHDTALTVFKEKELRRIEQAEKQVGLSSLLEMIPGVNIAAALDGAASPDGYRDLSKAQQHLKVRKSPDSDEGFKAYLIKRYHIEDQKDNLAFIEAMEWIFVNLDDPSRSINFYTEDKRYILNQIPELVDKCRERSQHGETDSKKMLASALMTVIALREKDEVIVSTELQRIGAFNHLGYSPPEFLPSSYLKRFAEGTEKLHELLVLVSSQ